MSGDLELEVREETTIPGVGRVCLYARQQCTIAAGCEGVRESPFDLGKWRVSIAALTCERRGFALRIDEIEDRRLDLEGTPEAARPRMTVLALARAKRMQAALDAAAPHRDGSVATVAAGST